MGWSSVMLAVLLLGGVQLVMIGVLGEYLWRILDESRGRRSTLSSAPSDETST
jgi:dolichol-phosphate mannosyltransferase